MERDWDVLADRLSSRAIAEDRPTEWFDELYDAGSRGEVAMPWDRDEPHPLLREWAEDQSLDGSGLTAVAVGCGLGADAEYLASLGFATTAFDVSPSAVRLARQRHPGSDVAYGVGDLLALPARWVSSFDLVVEIFTLQALPDPPRDRAAAGVRSLVAPGGRLLAVALRHDGSGSVDSGPPFPQPRELFDRLAGDELVLARLEEVEANGPRWRAELHRPARHGRTGWTTRAMRHPVPMAIHITGDERADQVLQDSSFALLTGMLLDQQFPMERAFAGPAKILDRFGSLEPAEIAAADPEQFASLCAEPPAVHRFPGSMAERVQAVARIVVEDYDGRAERIWTEAADAKDLLGRMTSLPGFGKQKAQIFIALLAKQLDVAPQGWEGVVGDYALEGYRSVADVVDEPSLQKVRAYKQEKKAAAKAAAS